MRNLSFLSLANSIKYLYNKNIKILRKVVIIMKKIISNKCLSGGTTHSPKDING